MLLDHRTDIGSFSPSYQSYYSSYGESDAAKELKAKVNDVRRVRPPSFEETTSYNRTEIKQPHKAVNRQQRRAARTTFKVGRFKAQSITERLVAHLVRFKLLLSLYSRYLSEEWAAGIKSQLDFLFEPSEWPEDEPLPTEASFTTFLQFKITGQIDARPSLGVSPDGRMVASWITESAQLSAEFDETGILWGAVKVVDGQQLVLSGYLKHPHALPAELVSGPWFAHD